MRIRAAVARQGVWGNPVVSFCNDAEHVRASWTHPSTRASPSGPHLPRGEKAAAICAVKLRVVDRREHELHLRAGQYAF